MCVCIYKHVYVYKNHFLLEKQESPTTWRLVTMRQRIKIIYKHVYAYGIQKSYFTGKIRQPHDMASGYTDTTHQNSQH